MLPFTEGFLSELAAGRVGVPFELDVRLLPFGKVARFALVLPAFVPEGNRVSAARSARELGATALGNVESLATGRVSAAFPKMTGACAGNRETAGFN